MPRFLIVILAVAIGILVSGQAAGAQTRLEVVHAFAGGSDGANPQASLIQATDGVFYGTTTNGGAFNLGTIFKMTPGGIVTVLHSFAGGADGAFPCCDLTPAADGDFYGTTIYGGTPGFGTVFKMTRSGTVTVLHPFTGSAEGGYPRAPLLQATDGTFYGISSGGSRSSGVLFSITPGGTFSVLWSFGPPVHIPFPPLFPDPGYPPVGRLIQGGSFNQIYGITAWGGRLGNGTIFWGPPWVLPVHDFTSAGGRPLGGLVEAADGNFYGTVAGPNGVFRMSQYHEVRYLPGGVFSQVPLIQATDGNFYGTTSGDGVSDYGTVFRMTPAGTVTVLHQFTSGFDGANPRASLVQAADGSFYGTTFSGGISGAGVVFRVSPPPRPPTGPPPATTLMSPVGKISANAPTYTWNVVPDASVYHLSVNDDSGTPVIRASYDAAVCGAATCSATPDVPLSAGTYTWFVQTGNHLGLGPVSSSRTFVTSPKRAGDFDGDGTAEIAVYRPSSGTWYVRGAASATIFGGYGDLAVSRDYDGDGSADIAVYRPSTGDWYIWQSSSKSLITYTWGGGDDIPIPADYDGDGLADIAVFRPLTGTWYIWNSGTLQVVTYTFGGGGDIPAPADYDGDGLADIAVYRPSTGAWHIWRSSSWTVITYTLGGWADVPVPGHYVGDGRADIAVFRPATGAWYIWEPGTLDGITYTFGVEGDIPVPGDYDGDGRTDIAVFRPATGAWYVWQSATRTGFSTTWGGWGDIPILKHP